jgi:hypothetical protein
VVYLDVFGEASVMPIQKTLREVRAYLSADEVSLLTTEDVFLLRSFLRQLKAGSWLQSLQLLGLIHDGTRMKEKTEGQREANRRRWPIPRIVALTHYHLPLLDSLAFMEPLALINSLIQPIMAEGLAMLAS